MILLAECRNVVGCRLSRVSGGDPNVVDAGNAKFTSFPRERG